MKPRIGLIARSDNSGLGNQTTEFYRHMKPAKTMVIDLSDYNHMQQYPERFSEIEGTTAAVFVKGFPVYEAIDIFLRDIDIVFTCETPYNYVMWQMARERGIKIVQQYNWEFLDYLIEWGRDYPKPDLFASPSAWHHDTLQFENKLRLPVPVDRERCKYRTRHDPTQFLHIVGNAATHDRNGTNTVLEAVQYVKSPEFRLYVRVQKIDDIEALKAKLLPDETRVEFLYEDIENYWDLYDKGNILLMPRRFGGLCLPMQEAASTGMPIITTDISPNNDWLPKEWLLPARQIDEFTTREPVAVYTAEPQDLAAKCDQFIRLGLNNMKFCNLQANNCARPLDWRTMEDEYRQVFIKLLRGELVYG